MRPLLVIKASAESGVKGHGRCREAPDYVNAAAKTEERTTWETRVIITEVDKKVIAAYNTRIRVKTQINIDYGVIHANISSAASSYISPILKQHFSKKEKKKLRVIRQIVERSFNSCYVKLRYHCRSCLFSCTPPPTRTPFLSQPGLNPRGPTEHITSRQEM